MNEIALDRAEVAVATNGEDWRVAWYPAPDLPTGTPHGAAAICLVGDQVVLVSSDGEHWGLPGGRPERHEDLVDTLRREIREEACATVTSSTLLGFSRGRCVRGLEKGLVLFRSMWRAEVLLEAWQPEFEITQRRLVRADDALGQLFGHVRFPDELRPLYRRTFAEAGLPVRQ